MKKVILLGLCLMLVFPVMNVTAGLNSPPDIPTIEGNSSGETGTEYEYRFCSSDPDGDEIYYCIDWDDGAGEICVGPFPSGTCFAEKHTWSSDGTYNIKVKAQDSNQAESDYATLSVTMPKTRTYHFYFQMILEMILTKIGMFRELIL
ncbi:MAG: PKD domain-containing protein [Thermoplasmatales archaeon]|nr:MAG: PKD domain-containing protein [Thermoplasmatales archaeon]